MAATLILYVGALECPTPTLLVMAYLRVEAGRYAGEMKVPSSFDGLDIALQPQTAAPFFSFLSVPGFPLLVPPYLVARTVLGPPCTVVLTTIYHEGEISVCSRRQMINKDYEFSRGVVEMGWIMLSVDYSRLFWLLFGVFSYENHEGKPRIFF
ncbi:hypothetical protein NL676_018748 [Syzygium grande]|nr:hypothetical protein NL676_018748 [Syzygium grande]